MGERRRPCPWETHDKHTGVGVLGTAVQPDAMTPAANWGCVERKGTIGFGSVDTDIVTVGTRQFPAVSNVQRWYPGIGGGLGAGCAVSGMSHTNSRVAWRMLVFPRCLATFSLSTQATENACRHTSKCARGRCWVTGACMRAARLNFREPSTNQQILSDGYQDPKTDRPDGKRQKADHLTQNGIQSKEWKKSENRSVPLFNPRKQRARKI